MDLLFLKKIETIEFSNYPNIISSIKIILILQIFEINCAITRTNIPGSPHKFGF